jgi:hypothetical protein
MAIRARPGRIGARMNLVLTLLALGREDDARRELTRLERDAPAFLYEAAGRRGVNVPLAEAPERLEAALALMAGNRSSRLYTLIDPASRELRVIPPPEPWIAHARHTLPVLVPYLAPHLDAALATMVFGGSIHDAP